MVIERTKNASRNIVFGVVLKLYQILVPFAIRTIMIYFMGVEYLGLNSLFTSILQVLNLTELGVGSAMVYNMYKPIAENDAKSICALLNLYKLYYRIIGVVIAVTGIGLTYFIPQLVQGELPGGLNIYALYLLNLAATVMSYWLFAYKSALFTAHQRIDIISKVTLFTSTLQYMIQIFIIIIMKDYYLFVIVSLAAQVLNNIVTALLADKYYPDYQPFGKLEKGEVKQINSHIRDLFTAKVGSVVINSVDTLVISAYLGLTVLAVYQNYYFIMNAIAGFILVILNAVIAGIGNSLILESNEKNYSDLKVLTFIICWILCVCCSCFTGMYQPFMQLWVGKELMLPNQYVFLFCIYFYLCQLTMIWAVIKDAAGMWHKDRFRPLIGSLVNLFLNFLLVRVIGLYGIILSTIISYAFVTMPWLMLNLFRFLYEKPMKRYMIRILKYMFLTVISCCITAVISQWDIWSGISLLVINGIISFLISNVIQFIFLRQDEEFLQSSNLLKQIISNKRRTVFHA